MTVLYTQTFTGSNGAAWPDFTTDSVAAGGTQDIQSNQGRLLTTATNFNIQRAILPSGSWSKADGEALFQTAIQATFGQFFVILRASGNWFASDNTMANTGYRVLVDHNAGQVLVFADVATVTTQIGATVSGLTFNANTTYWNRFRCQGNTITYKFWDAAGAEPGSNTYSGTDSTVPGAGQFQVAFRTVSTAVRDLRVDTLTLDDLTVAAGVPAVRPIRRKFGG